MLKTLHVLAWAVKGLGVLTAFGKLDFISPKWGPIIFMLASWGKDALIGLGDILDDGQRNNSFQPNLPGLKCLLPFLLAAGLAIGGTGCMGGAAMIRAAGKDPSAATLQIRTIYGTAIYSRGGASTNSVEVTEAGAIKQNQ